MKRDRMKDMYFGRIFSGGRASFIDFMFKAAHQAQADSMRALDEQEIGDALLAIQDQGRIPNLDEQETATWQELPDLWRAASRRLSRRP